jgi:YD repeat-containing protein
LSPPSAPPLPTRRTNQVLRVCTVAAIVAFIVLQIVIRHSRNKPIVVRFKSQAELARIPLSHDSYPCLLVERSGQELRANLTTCAPALHNDSVIEQYEVDLRSGRFTLRQTDLFVADSMPLALTRGYRLWDRVRAFGIGGNHPYDMFPYGDRFPYTYMEVLLGDGVTVHYDRITEGSSYIDDVKEHRGTANTVFQNSRIAWNRDHWDMTFRDGTLYRFPEAYNAKRGAEAALVGMRNPQGQEITLVRDAAHNLKSITSPAHHAIQLAYDDSNRIVDASDDAGDSVHYSYDLGGRLAEVRKNGKPLWRYSYDETGMTSVERIGTETVLNNRYSRGRMASLTIGKARTYSFDYLFEPKNRVVETLVVAPDGNRRVYRF